MMLDDAGSVRNSLVLLEPFHRGRPCPSVAVSMAVSKPIQGRGKRALESQDGLDISGGLLPLGKVCWHGAWQTGPCVNDHQTSWKLALLRHCEGRVSEVRHHRTLWQGEKAAADREATPADA